LSVPRPEENRSPRGKILWYLARPMSSTTSSPTGLFSTPRSQRWLMWISAAVLVAGVAVFLGVFLSRGSSAPAPAANLSTVSSAPPSTKSATSNPKVAASAGALKVARTFLETAVLRKNLDAAYGLVGPDLKGGMSRAQWRKGNIPVQPYPAANAKTAKFQVKSSHKNELMLLVELTPRKGSGVRPLAFYLNVDRIGGKWLVNYWLSDYRIPIHSNPYSN
jgi:hypothetical protein